MMDFGFYLPCYWPDTAVPMQHMYREMTAEAKFAEDLGFVSFTIPEHHFTNALVHPNPLLTAIKVAENTRHAKLITSTTVLPFHDVRVLAGEIAQADCLTNGRIEIGVGRGAYQYEFERLQIDPATAPDRFRENLNCLVKLLSEEDVSWDGQYVKFPPTTITPRPVQKPHPPIWFAAMTPGGIDYACSLAMSVLTTPLRDPFKRVREQAGSFKSSAAKYWGDNHRLKLSMLIMLFVTTSEADAKEKAALAMGRHRRFLNVYTTKGTVERGAIVPMESDISIEDVERNLVIGPPELCIEKLKMYEAEGIDNMQINMNWGTSHRDVMRSLEAFATKVMPHFG